LAGGRATAPRSLSSPRTKKSTVERDILQASVRWKRRELDVDVVAAQNRADDYLVKPFDKNELLARVKVGVRVLALETSLANRVKELEARASEIQELKLQMPL
jgi:DNA-binding response OmpR family regulator